jgi:hypothetical protein
MLRALRIADYVPYVHYLCKFKTGILAQRVTAHQVKHYKILGEEPRPH